MIICYLKIAIILFKKNKKVKWTYVYIFLHFLWFCCPGATATQRLGTTEQQDDGGCPFIHTPASPWAHRSQTRRIGLVALEYSVSIGGEASLTGLLPRSSMTLNRGCLSQMTLLVGQSPARPVAEPGLRSPSQAGGGNEVCVCIGT